jgi:uncharacterized membrane protein
MNPYQIMGIIACCTIVFAGLVTLLSMQGVHILLAFLGLYLLAVFLMLGMQRRAKESFELMEELKLRKYQQNSLMRRAHARDLQKWGQFSTHP